MDERLVRCGTDPPPCKLPVVGSIILTVGLLTFAFSTIAGGHTTASEQRNICLVQSDNTVPLCVDRNHGGSVLQLHGLGFADIAIVDGCPNLISCWLYKGY